MGSHINADGKFQSDRYPTCPAGKVPLSVNDKTAQDLLWEYAQRRRSVDAEFSADLETALETAGYVEPILQADEAAFLRNEVRGLRKTLAAAQKALEFAEPIAAQLVRSEPGKGGEKLHSWHLVVGTEAATLTRTHINEAVAALLQIREALREPVSK